MRPLLAAAVMTLILLALAATGHASVQEEMICWDPDVEFPVACEGEE